MRVTVRDRLHDAARAARRELLETDTRGLAIFRIAFGLAMLVYLISRVTDDSFVAFHTDLGVLPRTRALRVPFLPHAFSLFFMVGEPLEVALLFGLCGLVLLAFTVGYRTRTAAVGSLVVLLSLHHRLPHIVNAAMCISHLVALYGLALPLGRHYSVDAWLDRRRGIAPPVLDGERVRSLGVLAFRVQLFYVYFFNVVHKDGVTWADGTAIHYALRDERIVRTTTLWLREHLPRWFSPVATRGTLLLELVIAFGLISPIFPRASRRVVVASMLALHWAIAVVFQIGPFPVILPSAALLVAASGDFTRLDAWLAPRLSRLAQAVEARLGFASGSPRLVPRSVPPFLARSATAVRETYYVALALLVAMLVWHDAIFVSRYLGPFQPPPVVIAVGCALYIPQGWGMFGPDPARQYGAFVIDMEMADGRHVDPLRHARPDFEPFDHGAFGTDYFWQVYQPRLAEVAARDPELLDLFMDYLCRLPVLEGWRGTHRIEALQVFYVYASTPPPGARRTEPPRRLLLARRGARFTEPIRAPVIDASIPGAMDVRPSPPSPSPRGR